MESVGPWVQDTVRLLDSDGAYIHFKWSGCMDEQPAVGMDIIDVVRSRWCEMKNAEMEKKYGDKQTGGHH